MTHAHCGWVQIREVMIVCCLYVSMFVVCCLYVCMFVVNEACTNVYMCICEVTCVCDMTHERDKHD